MSRGYSPKSGEDFLLRAVLGFSRVGREGGEDRAGEEGRRPRGGRGSEAEERDILGEGDNEDGEGGRRSGEGMGMEGGGEGERGKEGEREREEGDLEGNGRGREGRRRMGTGSVLAMGEPRNGGVSGETGGGNTLRFDNL